MIPRQAIRGRSFVGAGKYYLHDKGHASTSERVWFTHTENLPTQDPEKALKWMAWTAMHSDELKRQSGSRVTSHRCEKPVFSLSLSWNPEQKPEKWQMIVAGRQAIFALGLHDHEVLMVAHNDCDHPHLHILANLVDPNTGRANRLSYSKSKLSKWAEEYEREHGKIYCEQRVENNRRRAEGEYVKYEEPELDLKATLTDLYFQCDSGKAFRAALAEHGLKLAQGNRILVVDRNGRTHSLSRQIEGASARDIRAKLADLELPDLDEARGQSGEGTDDPQTKSDDTRTDADADFYHDRDDQDRDWQESVIDAAIDKAEQERPWPKVSKPAPSAPPALAKTTRPTASKAPPRAPDSKLAALFLAPQKRPPSPIELNRAQDRRNHELGLYYDESTRRRLNLASVLENQYGEDERRLRADTEKLEGVLRNSSSFKLAWLKFWKCIPRNAEDELHNMRRRLENIEWRKAEAQQTLESDIRHRGDQIKARHDDERLKHQPKPPEAANDHQLESDAELDDDQDIGPTYGF